jgi:hypothetical protein
LDGLRQRRRCPVDVETPLACVLQNAFEALNAIGVVARTATDPCPLFLRGVPGGKCDAERRRIGDAVTRYSRRLGSGVTLEGGDHQ